MHQNWTQILDPSTGAHPTTPLQAMGFFLVKMSGTDPRLKADRPTAEAWLDAVGEFDPSLVVKAFAAHYQNAELERYPIRPSQARVWCLNAGPKRERCPVHPSYYLGKSCGGCRSERIELGLEKPIGTSTVPKLTGKAVPRPANWADLVKGIEA